MPLKINVRSLRRIDWPGSILSLAASVMLIFALEESGTVYAWDSVIIIASFEIQGFCWILFAAWETLLSSELFNWPMLPIFPTRLVSHRVVAAAIL